MKDNLKILLNSHSGAKSNFRPKLLFTGSINLFLDIVIKNSYFSLKPNIKPEKCSIMKITMLKEIKFYGMQHWYPPIMIEPTLPKNMQQMKQWITRLNDVNNYLKEESK